MQRSDSIGELATAIAKAQGQMRGALKDSANPFFKSKYADLASIWDAIREPFSVNGLAVLQFARSTPAGVEVETTLVHESGELMSETLAMPVAKQDAQGVGSAITYARRYGLAAIAGVAPDDDDGNAASGNLPSAEQVAASARDQHEHASKAVTEAAMKADPHFAQVVSDHVQLFKTIATTDGLPALDRAWQAQDTPMDRQIRKAVIDKMGRPWWNALKATAKAVKDYQEATNA